MPPSQAQMKKIFGSATPLSERNLVWQVDITKVLEAYFSAVFIPFGKVAIVSGRITFSGGNILDPAKRKAEIDKIAENLKKNLLVDATSSETIDIPATQVVLKLAPANDIAKLKAEKGFLKQHRHPNLIRRLGGTNADRLDENLEELLPDYKLFVMQYFPGRRLKDFVPENPGLELERAIRIFWPVVDAVSHLEECNSFHGDLSYNNVLVDEKDKPCLIDMEMRATWDTGTNRLETNAQGGTRYFYPSGNTPDTVIGWRKRTLYALGQLFYYLLHGACYTEKKPFGKERLDKRFPSFVGEILENLFGQNDGQYPGIIHVLRDITTLWELMLWAENLKGLPGYLEQKKKDLEQARKEKESRDAGLQSAQKKLNDLQTVQEEIRSEQVKKQELENCVQILRDWQTHLNFSREDWKKMKTKIAEIKNGTTSRG
jgi:serine/threonine protein kinase